MLYYERNLPHWQPAFRDLFVTWRLFRSLPGPVLDALRKADFPSAGRKFKAFEAYLDCAGHGPTWLRKPEIARIVMKSILDCEQSGMCTLHAFVLMPNHVHVLLRPRIDLQKITRFIKGRSAREANAMLGRTGQTFWQKESFDRWVRTESEFNRVSHYIRNNPVKANLVRTPDAWPWLMTKT
jgi:REP element-mobilizing transposase RayT